MCRRRPGPRHRGLGELLRDASERPRAHPGGHEGANHLSSSCRRRFATRCQNKLRLGGLGQAADCLAKQPSPLSGRCLRCAQGAQQLGLHKLGPSLWQIAKPRESRAAENSSQPAVCWSSEPTAAWQACPTEGWHPQGALVIFRRSNTESRESESARSGRLTEPRAREQGMPWKRSWGWAPRRKHEQGGPATKRAPPTLAGSLWVSPSLSTKQPAPGSCALKNTVLY